MWVGLFILFVSGVLLLYWVHSACLVTSRERVDGYYIRHVAEANGLSFLDSRSLLEDTALEWAAYQSLHRSLHCDYRLLTYLLSHSAAPEAALFDLRHWLLRADYWMLALAYAVLSRLSTALARRTLLQTSVVLGHLADAVGERGAVTART